jgi:hypothetical protein
MIGRKIPHTNERALAYMACNVASDKARRKLKRQARREDRRFQKSLLAEAC